jgi:hypothetical protein
MTATTSDERRILYRRSCRVDLPYCSARVYDEVKQDRIILMKAISLKARLAW